MRSNQHGGTPGRRSRWVGHRCLAGSTRLVAAGSALLLCVALAPLTAVSAAAAVAPAGQGFTVTPSDLAFILKQIKIAERHAATLTADDPCGTLVGPAPDQIPDRLTSYGLRTVDGSCNNLFPAREAFASTDQPFPRLTTPIFRAAEPITASLPVGAPGPTSYEQKKGSVVDSQPRVISNLIDDQTSTNPAAIAAAGFPVRTQGNPGLHPCTTDPDPTALPDPIVGSPPGCVPSHHTLFIPNVTTDIGLSPPYNSLFTFFGQFFDHGLDQTVKSGGTVFVPLRADDPLVTLGPDGIAGTNCHSTDPALPPKHCDEVPPNQAFMVLTRAQNQPGPDGILGDRSPTSSGPPACTSLNAPVGCDESADDIQDATNTDTPWVDQSQTYTSHASHQVFLREYVNNADGKPVSTGRLLGGSPGNGATGMATWASVKAQAATLLGLQLVDRDVVNVPMLATDPYGKFIPGPDRGLPQYVTKTGMVEGDVAHPVPVPANVLHFDTPFLTDIAHNADPSPQDIDNNPATPPVAPVPDADSTPSADFAGQAPGTYDDEMLNAHFACGDGRCNENIALTTIHQIFLSEHDRLVDYIKNVLTSDTSASGIAALPQWQLPSAENPSGWNGERLFQAARFVNEMEYQHLVFEEFARKVQPAIRPFHGYQPDIQPAIEAEFAHAVYRFGHSMLDETVARTNVDPATGVKSDNSIPLLTAFLNPPEYVNGGTAGTLTPAQAAGSVVMGSSDQVGNELDEFVTETLRNNLLGLPLDLPTLNLTRAREAGVPPLNEFRRQIFAQTNDGSLVPYSSWAQFGQHLKHPESLINFVAAYGLHPTIRDSGPDAILGNADDVTTIAAKRAAAKAIVDPGPTDTTPIPDDAADFMLSTGPVWGPETEVGSGRPAAPRPTTTGLDDVDLWVGGLAEATNVFGGLLGSTFNYVFQTQLEKLQDGDRLYYIARTAGLNLMSQLEGNSFAELIQRNTDGTDSLKADAFATADCRFQLAHLHGTADDFLALGSTVADDPTTTDCDESKLLLRKPDGTIQYRAVNSVDKPGINGQSVYNGTPGVDRIEGGSDNDTFWGGDGNDVIEGNGGNDVALGSDGNDIITDAAGADILKGGPGNDAVDAGIGDDNLFGGDGQDFTNGGLNDNATFGGPGDDFTIAGQGADTVRGDAGDDWIEGGAGQDLLDGDYGAPFFDDPAQAQPGNDIFIGQDGGNTYNAEGGDDLMAQNAAIDLNAGAGGFDWAFHQFDTVGADDDMNINNNLIGVPLPVVVNRDRWQETEADSGSAFDDTIKGDDVAPMTVGGAGFTGCDVLDQAGADRISGLFALLPHPFTGDRQAIVDASMPDYCPLTGPVWGAGNILLGGAGSDTITGRGADDIIDGDKSLAVRISVRDPADRALEIGTTDLMEHTDSTGTFGPGTGKMTLQQAVFAGIVDPGNLVAVREILTLATVPPPDCGAAVPLNCDTAVFSGPASNYSIEAVPDGAGPDATLGAITVTQTGPNVKGQKVSDGVDTLRNIERLEFFDQTTGKPTPSFMTVSTPAAPTAVAAVPGVNSATVTWTAPATNGGPAITGYDIVATPVSGPVVKVTVSSGTATSHTVLGLTAGTSYAFQVRAVIDVIAGPLSTTSSPVVPTAPVVPPGAPTGVAAVAGVNSATVNWTAPATNGGPAITSYEIVTSPPTVAVTVSPGTATSYTVSGLSAGTPYTFQVRAVNRVDPGELSGASDSVTPTPTPPTASTRVTAVRGNGSVTLSWADGLAPVTGHVIQVTLDGAYVRRYSITGVQTTTVVTGLVNGSTYTFAVQATNGPVSGPLSAASNRVTPATFPGRPRILPPGQGRVGGARTAVARWSAPTTGGSPIRSYRVTAQRMAANGTRLVSQTSFLVAATVRHRQFTLAAGHYRFTVVAINAVGHGVSSHRSALVQPR